MDVRRRSATWRPFEIATPRVYCAGRTTPQIAGSSDAVYNSVVAAVFFDVCSAALTAGQAMFTDGFLGYRTSFMLDFVVCALLIIVPVLATSIWLVKIGNRYHQHRVLQTLLCVVLLVAVGAFEIDLQIVHGGWENVVRKSYTNDALLAERISEAQPWLWLHLVFAVTTPIVWLVTIAMAWKRFAVPPAPGAHSQLHRRLGWISTIDVTLTAITGLIFYWVAFVAE